MALVSFTLSEEGVGAFNDALICVNRFSDDVCLEVRKDKVCIYMLIQSTPAACASNLGDIWLMYA